jgi:hypothetical protein
MLRLTLGMRVEDDHLIELRFGPGSQPGEARRAPPPRSGGAAPQRDGPQFSLRRGNPVSGLSRARLGSRSHSFPIPAGYHIPPPAARADVRSVHHLAGGRGLRLASVQPGNPDARARRKQEPRPRDPYPSGGHLPAQFGDDATRTSPVQDRYTGCRRAGAARIS